MSDLPTGRYTEVHKAENLKGAGDARPTALQIVEDEGLIGKLDDKVVLITGVSSGLGIETLRAMAATGATVYGTARDLEKGRTALGSLLASPKVHLLHLDLESLDSVRACAADFKRQSNKLNILINNAGVMHTPEGRTKDGFETQFGVNHLAHFLLFNLLKDLLIASATPEFCSRTVDLTSSGHRLAGINWGNISFEGEYDGYNAYGQSKTANILMAKQIDRLYGSQGLHGYSVHPGSAFTGLQVHRQEEMEQVKQVSSVLSMFKSDEQGAATTLYAALSRDLEGRGPFYMEDCEVMGQAPPGIGWFGTGYASWAWNQDEEERLWKLSLEMVGLDG